MHVQETPIRLPTFNLLSVLTTLHRLLYLQMDKDRTSGHPESSSSIYPLSVALKHLFYCAIKRLRHDCGLLAELLSNAPSQCKAWDVSDCVQFLSVADPSSFYITQDTLIEYLEHVPELELPEPSIAKE